MVVSFLKIIGGLVAFLLIVAAVGFLLLKKRIDSCRKSSDTMISEYSSGKSASGLLSKALDEGFTSFTLRNETSGKDYQVDVLNDQDKAAVRDLQSELNKSQKARLEIIIVPIPPFLRWGITFKIENGIVTNVERWQVD